MQLLLRMVRVGQQSHSCIAITDASWLFVLKQASLYLSHLALGQEQVVVVRCRLGLQSWHCQQSRFLGGLLIPGPLHVGYLRVGRPCLWWLLHLVFMFRFYLRLCLLCITAGLVSQTAKCSATGSCAFVIAVIYLSLGLLQLKRLAPLLGQFFCTGAMLVRGRGD